MTDLEQLQPLGCVGTCNVPRRANLPTQSNSPTVKPDNRKSASDKGRAVS
jgi:hypothetical protein